MKSMEFRYKKKKRLRCLILIINILLSLTVLSCDETRRPNNRANRSRRTTTQSEEQYAGKAKTKIGRFFRRVYYHIRKYLGYIVVGVLLVGTGLYVYFYSRRR